jgi:trehalose-6-phosphate synthase
MPEPEGVDPGPYHLHRVPLSPREVAGYYAGYANQGLWPLSHLLVERARFRQDDWEQYRRVNRRFAETAASRAPRRARVFSHDYHLALFPAWVRKLRPDVEVIHFWHIPWPPWRVLRLCPQWETLVTGLLGADVLGFQTEADRAAFFEAVGELDGAVLGPGDWIRWEGRALRAGVFPVPVDGAGIADAVGDPRMTQRIRRLRRRLAPDGQQVVVSVDRADYTKGILTRLNAVETFFARDPERLGRVTFVQVVSPTRLMVPEYRELFAHIVAESARLNVRFGRAGWRPLVTVARSVDRLRVLALLAAADVALVTSLYDGMNLVAKEFVASRVADDGVLVLSQSAGAAEGLTGAMMVSPLDPDGMADMLAAALAMPDAERRRRMRALRKAVLGYGTREWLDDLLGSATADSARWAWNDPSVAPVAALRVASGAGRS